jgi:hypothetical protein
MEPEDLLHSHRRRGAGFYCLLLFMLSVTFLLFSQVMTYAFAQSDGAIVTGKVEGPAVTGLNPSLDKALAPLMPLLSCHEISYQGTDKVARRFSACWFDFAKHPVGEQVKLAYAGGDAAIADPMTAIRAGVAASLWLTFSLLVFFRLPRR